jgi:hypothetical protein
MNVDPEDKQATKEWAEKALNAENQIEKALFAINNAMMGENVLLPGALIQIFSEKVSSDNDHLPQSRKWIAADYLLDMLVVQGKGYSVLIAAREVLKSPNVDTLKEEMKRRFEDQVAFSKTFMNELSYEFVNTGWGDQYFKWAPEPYVDTWENIADSGKVVVGLELYQKGNRIWRKNSAGISQIHCPGGDAIHS